MATVSTTSSDLEFRFATFGGERGKIETSTATLLLTSASTLILRSANTTALTLDTSQNATFAGTITKIGGAFLLATSSALTAGATSNVPTLTSGPVTGNPTKWVAINDNGTTRYIPAW